MRKSSYSKSTGVKVTAKQREQLLDVLKPDLKAIVQDGVDKYVGTGTRFLLEMLLHAEARELCGKRYERSPDRRAVRWSVEQGTAIIDGARRRIERPRVRFKRGLDDIGEVQLATYKAMNRADLLDGPLVASILAGVSARKYADIVLRGIEAKGVKRSSVSRKSIKATKPMVDEFRRSSLKQDDFTVLIFDGVHVQNRQIICCIGIDLNGNKRALGIRVGATENEVVCRDLIRDLVERGLSTDKDYLFVIDGSKALIASIRAAFGQDAVIQRCQEHKIRDVQGYLPTKLRVEFREKMQAAYNQKTEKQAFQRLTKVRLELSLISENAANALTEGMHETLTLHRLGINGFLRDSLRTTNIIESAFSSVRRYMGRVTSFHDEAQRELWVIRSLLEAQRHFRTLRGNRQLRKLRQNLRELRVREENHHD
jgi:transposase-like protein